MEGVTHTSVNVLDDLGLTREDMAALVAKREKRIAELESEVAALKRRLALHEMAAEARKLNLE